MVTAPSERATRATTEIDPVPVPPPMPPVRNTMSAPARAALDFAIAFFGGRFAYLRDCRLPPGRGDFRA